MDKQNEVTRLLAQIREGDEDASAKLIPVVYKELRRMAAGIMKRERPDHTLQPTAVVHEAYLRLLDGRRVDFKDRSHFFASAASSMRRVLVDHARRRVAVKRGGDVPRQTESGSEFALTELQSEEVLALHEALRQLQALDARQAQIVEMHYFAGNAVGEIAELFGIGERTVKRELQTARLFLKRHLKSQTGTAR